MIFLNILTEKILLKQIKEKNRKAAERLIDHHYNAVYTFLLKLGKNKELAEYLTQETFLKTWNSLDKFNGNSRISTWLYRISYNVFIDQIKKQKIHVNSADDNYYDTITDQTPSNEFFKNNRDDIFLSSAIESLSEKQKEMIIWIWSICPHSTINFYLFL